MHTNTPHLNGLHTNVSHGNSPYLDTYGHGNSPYIDVSHLNVTHLDSPHSNVGYTDVNHQDINHTDVPHQDSVGLTPTPTNVSYGVAVGDGTEQAISHGLTGVPTLVLVSEYRTGNAFPYQIQPADAFNVYITAVSGQTYIWRAEIFTPSATKNAGIRTGTGAQQTIVHGLGFTPTLLYVMEYGTGVAFPYESAAPDVNNIYVSAVVGKTWEWMGEVVIPTTSRSFGTSTGTGAEQTIPHGLSAKPTCVLLWEDDTPVAHPYQSTTASAFAIYITATIGKTYSWSAEVI